MTERSANDITTPARLVLDAYIIDPVTKLPMAPGVASGGASEAKQDEQTNLLGDIKTSNAAIQAVVEDDAPAVVSEEATSWVYISASSTDTAVGNANDQLDSILVIPATKSPGAVSIEDGDGTNRTLFSGGDDSVSTLIPFPIDMRNIAAGTAWEITTGANVAVIAFYRQRA